MERSSVRQSTSHLYVTFKVVQLINHLRRRLKPRVKSIKPQDGPFARSFATDFSKITSNGISSCLSSSAQRQYKVAKQRHGVHKSSSPRLLPKDWYRANADSKASLNSLAEDLGYPDLANVAANDEQFVRQSSEPLFGHLSWRQAAVNICLVNKALKITEYFKSANNGPVQLCNLNEQASRPAIDEKTCANLEHLLLRIRHALEQLLVRKLTELFQAEAVDWHLHWRRQLKYGGNKWCAEFSNNQRPLSTTWPWSIRPSLAVLWGVCWMFFPPIQEGSSDNSEYWWKLLGGLCEPQSAPIAHIQGTWNAPAARSANCAPQQLRVLRTQRNADDENQWHGADKWRKDSPSRGENGLRRQAGDGFAEAARARAPGCVLPSRLGASFITSSSSPPQAIHSSHAFPTSSQNSSHRQAPQLVQSFAPDPSGTSTLSNAIRPAYFPSGIPGGVYRGQNASTRAYRPEPLSPDCQSVVATRRSCDTQVSGREITWHHPRHQKTSATTIAFSAANPNPGQTFLTPNTARVTRADGSNCSTQPRSASSLYCRSSPQEFQYSLTSTSNLQPASNRQTLYQLSSMSETEVSQLERAPDSLRSAVDPALEGPPHSDHVQHHEQYPDPSLQHTHVQDLHGHPDHIPHHPDMTEDMSSPDHQEPFSPRRGYTHKRNEDPPRNNQGKMVCKFQSTCSGLVFDRRCEWSKHMDKHDRPYKCQEPGCEKLQGFTYSGGLLRHQREVHKMHGGTKKALYCPEINCKRHSGSGFTRKENLSEHIRRVHRRTTDGSDIAAQAQNGLDQLEAAAAAAAQAAEDDGMATDGTERSAKRKRLDPALTNGDGVYASIEGALEGDAVKRLRNENQELKDRMKQMEEDMQQQRTLLQELLTRQHPPAPTAPMV